ncbi:MAG TPA: glycosyl transferase, partial [Bacteroidetes bacterium]|nr:glycosyl transferase [Bacteroidota bacterium]
EYNINNKINIFLKRLFDLVTGLISLITIYPIVFIYSKITGNKLSRHTSKILQIPYVVSGRYSLVGYPIWFNSKEEAYPGKKGLTGLIQLYYYEGMTEQEMINYNIYYAKNQNLTLDLEILLKTIFTFLKK